jgi:hypothetical protein
MLDPTQFRLRYFAAIVLAAVLMAALLRHVLHVYGVLFRQDIRIDVLIAAVIVAAAVLWFEDGPCDEVCIAIISEVGEAGQKAARRRRCITLALYGAA